MRASIAVQATQKEYRPDFAVSAGYYNMGGMPSMWEMRFDVTVPLRRALVSQSDLPYPEGVAAAEVLKVGTSSRSGAAEGKLGLMAVIWGSVASALFAALAAAAPLQRRQHAQYRKGRTY